MGDTVFQKYLDTLNKMLTNIEKAATGKVSDFKQLNQLLYGDISEEKYKRSYANPDFAKLQFGNLGALMCAIYYEFRKSIDYGYFKMTDELQKIISIYNNLTVITLSEYAILGIYIALRRVNDSGRARIDNDYILTDTFYKEVAKLCIDDTENIYRYNQLISHQDIIFMDYFKNYDEKKIENLSVHIGKMLLHGFVSQGRDPGSRKTVIIYYEIGQERLAAKISEFFNKTVCYHVRIVSVSGFYKPLQYEYDHLYDVGLYLDKQSVEAFALQYKQVVEEISNLLQDQCGRIRIGQFGALPDPPSVNRNAVTLRDAQQGLFLQLANISKAMQGKFVNPAAISLCSVTIPNQAINGNFVEIFEDFYAINTTNSEPFENLQQILIDEMDKANWIEVSGRRGNDTHICIKLQPLEDISRQTNFMNCGGDINIPYGEVFTTPQLKGTHGLLHFKSVFLKGYHYKDLRLSFVDGYVEEYYCRNFASENANKEYILNTLFKNIVPMPIGEFSIGTNTTAYAVIMKHGILDSLPILLVEKLGPHFAIGDPCYARGEEEAVFNRLNGKEILPKENEHSAKRHIDPTTGYTNVHTDITIPYEDIGYLTAVNSRGEKTDIIKDGIFVLPGVETLNQPLHELKRLQK